MWHASTSRKGGAFFLLRNRENPKVTFLPFEMFLFDKPHSQLLDVCLDQRSNKKTNKPSKRQTALAKHDINDAKRLHLGPNWAGYSHVFFALVSLFSLAHLDVDFVLLSTPTTMSIGPELPDVAPIAAMLVVL